MRAKFQPNNQHGNQKILQPTLQPKIATKKFNKNCNQKLQPKNLTNIATKKMQTSNKHCKTLQTSKTLQPSNPTIATIQPLQPKKFATNLATKNCNHPTNQHCNQKNCNQHANAKTFDCICPKFLTAKNIAIILNHLCI